MAAVDSLHAHLVEELTDLRDADTPSKTATLEQEFETAFRATSSLLANLDGYTRPLISPLLLRPIMGAWSGVSHDVDAGPCRQRRLKRPELRFHAVRHERRAVSLRLHDVDAECRATIVQRCRPRLGVPCLTVRHLPERDCAAVALCDDEAAEVFRILEPPLETDGLFGHRGAHLSHGSGEILRP
jgi:hypothetical protein